MGKRMNKLSAVALAAHWLTAPASAQINSVQGAPHAEGSPHTRLILAAGHATRQYELLKFTNATDACNFYGASAKQCTFASGGPARMRRRSFSWMIPAERRKSDGRQNSALAAIFQGQS
jgi:hypothetical protein